MQKKKGISLIVLVITIIVMTVLAATVIITLEDSEMIGRTKNTVQNSNYADEYTRLVVIKNGILTENLGTISVEEYIEELKNNGIIETEVVTNADGSTTITTQSGYKVNLVQVVGDLLIEFDGIQSPSGNVSGSESSTPDNVTSKAAGLYESGTETMLKSWADLIAERIVYVESKTLYSGDKDNQLIGDLVLPNDGSVTTIGAYAFEFCTEITKVELPNGITKIDKYAFAEMYSCRNINIPNSVTSIEEGAFFSSGLLSVEIPNSITVINEAVFRDAVELEEIIVPNNLIRIETQAFYNTNLKTITLPNTIESIGYMAFNYLEEVKYNGTKAQWQNVYKADGDAMAPVIICVDATIIN